MITMIVGVITEVGLLVTRMPGAGAAAPVVPPDLALPAGVGAQAVTFGRGWTAVVTTTDHILIFGSDGKLRQDIAIAAEGN